MSSASDQNFGSQRETGHDPLGELPPEIGILLLGHLTGELSIDEQAQLDSWTKADPGRAALVAKIGHEWNSAQPRPAGTYNAEAALRTAKRRELGVGSRKSNPSIRWTHAAGALALSLAVAAVAVMIKGDWLITPHAPVAKTYATHVAQRATVTLDDGTTAILAPATTLQVTGRKVVLAGEALFNVEHQGAEPFTVFANGVATRVLGTRFAVRAYDGESKVRVAVQSGKVAVNNVTLGAGDLVNVTDSGIDVSRDTAITAAIAFASGQLVLDRVPLAKAIPDLNRWFDVDIRIGDQSLAWRPLTGSPPLGNRADLAKSLEAVLGATAVRDGRVITLYEHP